MFRIRIFRTDHPIRPVGYQVRRGSVIVATGSARTRDDAHDIAERAASGYITRRLAAC